MTVTLSSGLILHADVKWKQKYGQYLVRLLSKLAGSYEQMAFNLVLASQISLNQPGKST